MIYKYSIYLERQLHSFGLNQMIKMISPAAFLKPRWWKLKPSPPPPPPFCRHALAGLDRTFPKFPIMVIGSGNPVFLPIISNFLPIGDQLLFQALPRPPHRGNALNSVRRNGIISWRNFIIFQILPSYLAFTSFLHFSNSSSRSRYKYRAQCRYIVYQPLP